MPCSCARLQRISEATEPRRWVWSSASPSPARIIASERRWLIDNSTPRGWWSRHVAIVADRMEIALGTGLILSPTRFPIAPIRAAAIGANGLVSPIPASTPIIDQPSTERSRRRDMPVSEEGRVRGGRRAPDERRQLGDDHRVDRVRRRRLAIEDARAGGGEQVPGLVTEAGRDHRVVAPVRDRDRVPVQAVEVERETWDYRDEA